MTDIHAHILFGVDDGAGNVSTAVTMADIAAESDTERILATPHCNIPGVFENLDPDKLRKNFEELKEAVDDAGIPLELFLGAEVYGTAEVPQLYKEGRLLTLNGGRYMLIEFDFEENAVFMQRVLYKLLDDGVIPVIAHPERYFALQSSPETAVAWHADGVAIQLNKGSLFGRFGRRAEKLAKTLLHREAVSCIASDAHGPVVRTPDMTDAYGYISVNYSEELAELLFDENPRRIVENRELLRIDGFQIY